MQLLRFSHLCAHGGEVGDKPGPRGRGSHPRARHVVAVHPGAGVRGVEGTRHRNHVGAWAGPQLGRRRHGGHRRERQGLHTRQVPTKKGEKGAQTRTHLRGAPRGRARAAFPHSQPRTLSLGATLMRTHACAHTHSCRHRPTLPARLPIGPLDARPHNPRTPCRAGIDGTHQRHTGTRHRGRPSTSYTDPPPLQPLSDLSPVGPVPPTPPPTPRVREPTHLPALPTPAVRAVVRLKHDEPRRVGRGQVHGLRQHKGQDAGPATAPHQRRGSVRASVHAQGVPTNTLDVLGDSVGAGVARKRGWHALVHVHEQGVRNETEARRRGNAGYAATQRPSATAARAATIATRHSR